MKSKTTKSKSILPDEGKTTNGTKGLKTRKNFDRRKRRQAVRYSSAGGSSFCGSKTHWLMNETTWRVYNCEQVTGKFREIPTGSGQTSHMPSHSHENTINSTNQPCCSLTLLFFSLFFISPGSCLSDYWHFSEKRVSFSNVTFFMFDSLFHVLVFMGFFLKPNSYK